MAVLADYSQICISCAFQIEYQLKGKGTGDFYGFDGDSQPTSFSEDLLRHVILNSILQYKRRFQKEYGEFIYCIDAKNSWRQQLFEYYKHHRKKIKESAIIDWDLMYAFMDAFHKELSSHFGYKVLKVKSAEADDLIAVLSQEMHQKEKILIISSDKDFLQLQRYPNITQFSPAKRDYLECDDPKAFLFDHVVRGDAGDGIPNIFSPLSSYKDKRKCKPVFAKKMVKWQETRDPRQIPEWDEDIIKRFKQNKVLIDFRFIPKRLKERIITGYDVVVSDKMNGHLTGDKLNYFVEHGLANLMGFMSEF